MKKAFIVLICGVLFLGCAHKMIYVITDPVGARIDVNNVYQGEAPLKLKFTSHGLFGGFYGYCNITATPTEPEQFLQNKLVLLDGVPEGSKILFNMYLKSNK